MKNILMALAILAASTTALAADVTASIGTNGGSRTEFGSLAVGKQFNGFRGEAVVTHAAARAYDTVGFNVVAPLTAVGGVSIGAKAGASYAFVKDARDGATLNLGVEAAYPLSKTVSLVGSVERVFAQNRVRGLEGNVVAVGIRTTF